MKHKCTVYSVRNELDVWAGVRTELFITDLISVQKIGDYLDGFLVLHIDCSPNDWDPIASVIVKGYL